LALVRGGQVHPLWAVPPLALAFVLIIIGITIEATGRTGGHGEILALYGLLGLAARLAFGHTLERRSRVRAILSERRLFVPEEPSRGGANLTFAVLNFFLAGAATVGILPLGWDLAHPGENVAEQHRQVPFGLIAIAYLVIGVILWSLAGLGLLRGRLWGFVLHVVGACWAALSCIGIVYTIPVMVMSAVYQPIIGTKKR
jgi:hypothetical protein